MNEGLLEMFFKVFKSSGHKSANNFLGINDKNFSIFSMIFDIDENIQNLEKSEFGGLLYTDNLDFVKKIESAIQENIFKEMIVYSDLYNSTIKMLIFRQSDQKLKFIYEIPSKLVLKVI
jgi:hypothetical protein